MLVLIFLKIHGLQNLFSMMISLRQNVIGGWIIFLLLVTLRLWIQKFSKQIFLIIYQLKPCFLYSMKSSLSLSRVKIANKEFFLEIVLVLLVSFIWETIEHYLETIWPLVGWFAGVEFWANRIIFDGFFVLLWFFFIKKFPKYIWPARIFSCLWLLVHIFIFPDSMYLHQIFSFEIPYIWWDKTTSILDFWSIEHFFTGMSIGFFVIEFSKKFVTCDNYSS